VFFFRVQSVALFPPTPIADPDLQALCQALADQLLAPEPPPDIKNPAQPFLVLVTCRDEKDQIELLGRLKEEGVGTDFLAPGALE
jgi:hypothetical protein